MTSPPFARSSFWYHSLLIYALIKAGHSFISCAPPRFNVFSENIVADWQTPDIQNTNEVMRSCGGAVQGVREIPLISSLYLNRADDGFVFFDCGTYTHGPVTLSDMENLFTTSISLSTRSRVLLSCTLDTNKKMKVPEIATLLHRVSFGDDGSSLQPEDFDVDVVEPHDIYWHHQLQCRVSSPGQSWMLQRAKWEMFGVEEASPDFEPITNVQAWSVAQSASDANPDDNTNGVVLTMGAMCTKAGSVKAIARTYNENGMLVRVALQTGKLQDS